MYCVTLHCIALHCIALHCMAIIILIHCLTAWFCHYSDCLISSRMKGHIALNEMIRAAHLPRIPAIISSQHIYQKRKHHCGFAPAAATETASSASAAGCFVRLRNLQLSSRVPWRLSFSSRHWLITFCAVQRSFLSPYQSPIIRLLIGIFAVVKSVVCWAVKSKVAGSKPRWERR